LVVKNGSKIRGSTSAGTPGPLSVTRTTTQLSSTAVSIVILPSPPARLVSACWAFWIRLVHHWLSSST